MYCTFPVLGVILMTFSGSSLGIIKPVGVFFLLCCCLSSAVYKTANRKSAEQFTPFERTYVLIFACAVGFTVSAIIKAKGDFSVYAEPMGERVDLYYHAEYLRLASGKYHGKPRGRTYVGGKALYFRSAHNAGICFYRNSISS